MTLLKNVLVASSLCAMAACAPNPAMDRPTQSADASARASYYVDQVRGFRSVDRTSLLLDAGRGRTFQAESVGFCQDMDFALTLAIRPESTGTSRLCTGDFARLSVSGAASGSGPCRVRIVKLLTDAEKAEAAKATS